MLAMRSLAVLPAFLLPPLLAACGGGGSSSGIPEEPPLLTLSETPTLEIGVMEGDPAYQFQDIASTGQIVCAPARTPDTEVH